MLAQNAAANVKARADNLKKWGLLISFVSGSLDVESARALFCFAA